MCLLRFPTSCNHSLHSRVYYAFNGHTGSIVESIRTEVQQGWRVTPAGS